MKIEIMELKSMLEQEKK
uniref:Uncharacterized protein n=1 Tax=Rhizophora mucronata TaxID=61149 RepID=A0A2P2NDC9_RHIMU